jgi:hypothetical protein
MGPIWTPNPAAPGLLRLQISDQSRASPEITSDEWLDCLALETMQRRGVEHSNTWSSLEALERIKALRDSAQRATRDAIEKSTGPAPAMTDARVIDLAATAHPSRSEAKVIQAVREEAMDTYEEMMRALLRRANDRDDAEADRHE